MKKWTAAAAGLGVAAALSFAGPASADPKGEVIQLDCDNGTTYWVAVQESGNGAWSPGHDTNSTGTLIPTTFGEFHGVVTDSTGEVIDEFTDPPMIKGSATKPRSTSVHCTYEVTDQFEDPDLGLLTFHGTGSVDAFVTPVR
jgi:hypothetical protein